MAGADPDPGEPDQCGSGYEILLQKPPVSFVLSQSLFLSDVIYVSTCSMFIVSTYFFPCLLKGIVSRDGFGF
jgi:hypothetical protein